MTDLFYWISHWLREEILAIPGRVIALVFAIILFLVPHAIPNEYFISVLILATIYSIYAASWDLLSGYAGQVSFGHSAFFGIGCYSAALLNIHLSFLPLWITIPLGGISSVMGGLILSIPALRLKGMYFSLVSLAFPVILNNIVIGFPDITGGELGLFGIRGLSKSQEYNYYLVLIVALVSIFVLCKFTSMKTKSVRIAVLLSAIREDEISARASGINTPKYKILAFSMSAFFAGIAGGLYVHIIKIAGPSTLSIMFSFDVVLWSIFGGLTTIYGPVTGVFMLYPLTELIRIFPFGDEIRFILFSLILIFTLLFMPNGLTVWVRDQLEVDCPRCKNINIFLRKTCRICGADLHIPQ